MYYKLVVGTNTRGRIGPPGHWDFPSIYFDEEPGALDNGKFIIPAITQILHLINTCIQQHACKCIWIVKI